MFMQLISVQNEKYLIKKKQAEDYARTVTIQTRTDYVIWQIGKTQVEISKTCETINSFYLFAFMRRSFII